MSNSTISGDAKLAASNNGVHPDFNWTSGSIPDMTKNKQTFKIDEVYSKMIHYINNSLHFGAKICSDICPWILSVLRKISFPEIVA